MALLDDALAIAATGISIALKPVKTSVKGPPYAIERSSPMPFDIVPVICTDRSYLGRALLCPRCKEGNLHHVHVTSYDREEDAEQTRLTHNSATCLTVTTIPSDQPGNPSGRRDGIAIGFYCEHCDGFDTAATVELTFAQHKGATFLAWRILERHPRNKE